MDSLVTDVLGKNALTCPDCGSKQNVEMLESGYSYAYQCDSCSEIIEKKHESCCVYCSYGEVKCPEEQIKWN
jgi:hypothetical protein